jgi:hypothetical protein
VDPPKRITLKGTGDSRLSDDDETPPARPLPTGPEPEDTPTFPSLEAIAANLDAVRRDNRRLRDRVAMLEGRLESDIKDLHDRLDRRRQEHEALRRSIQALEGRVGLVETLAGQTHAVIKSMRERLKL